jgi:hypothetical protein
LACQLRSPPGRLLRRPNHSPVFGVLAQLLGEKVEIPADDHQEVIEVGRDAAGQLANGFHFLRLPQRVFELPALGDLFVDTLLKRGVQLLQLGLGASPFDRQTEQIGDALKEVDIMFSKDAVCSAVGFEDAIGPPIANQDDIGGPFDAVLPHESGGTESTFGGQAIRNDRLPGMQRISCRRFEISADLRLPDNVLPPAHATAIRAWRSFRSGPC